MGSVIKFNGGIAITMARRPNVKPVDLTPMDPLRPGLGAVGNSSLPEDPAERAKRQAEIIVRTAHSEAETIKKQAYNEGFREGASRAAEQAQELIARLERDIAVVAEDRVGVVDAVEPQALKLCLEAVEKVIRHEVRTDPRVVLRVVKSCLRRIKDCSEVYVRVSSEELEHVKARHDELVGLAEGSREIHIVDDRRISPGGCVIETASGDLDARIETQLDKLNTKLVETMENDRLQNHSGPDELHTDDRQDGPDTD